MITISTTLHNNNFQLSDAALEIIRVHPELAQRIALFEKEFHPADTAENNAALDFALSIAEERVKLTRDLEYERDNPFYDSAAPNFYYGGVYEDDFEQSITGFRYNVNKDGHLEYIIELRYKAFPQLFDRDDEDFDVEFTIDTEVVLTIPNDPLNHDTYTAHEIERNSYFD